MSWKTIANRKTKMSASIFLNRYIRQRSRKPWNIKIQKSRKGYNIKIMNKKPWE